MSRRRQKPIYTCCKEAEHTIMMDTLQALHVSTQIGIDYEHNTAKWTLQQKGNTLGEYLSSNPVDKKKYLQKEKKMDLGKKLRRKIPGEDRQL